MRRAIIRDMVAGVRDPALPPTAKTNTPEAYAARRLAALLPQPRQGVDDARQTRRALPPRPLTPPVDRGGPIPLPLARRRANLDPQGRPLTPRQLTVLRLTAAEESIAAIATALGCSQANIKALRTRIYVNLRVRGLAEAVAWYRASLQTPCPVRGPLTHPHVSAEGQHRTEEKSA